MLFLCFGSFSIYFDPTIIFFWVWTLFMLVAFSLWLFSYTKRHKWVFEVTSNNILFESPFMPKVTLNTAIQDILEIRLFDGETTSGKIILKNGEILNVPGPCLLKTEKIADSINKIGLTVFLNNKRIN